MPSLTDVFISAFVWVFVMVGVLDFVLGCLVLILEFAPVLAPVLIGLFMIALMTHNRDLGAAALIALALLLSIRVVHGHGEPLECGP